jgi:ribulose-phosphate 3-epimerase
VVSALSDLVHGAGAIVDVHLMVARPERRVAEFARAAADLITIHVEATPHPHYALGAISDLGCLAGLALNPGTSADAVTPLAEMVDHVLCMTVNPGWGGQRFITSSWSKLAQLRALLPEAVSLQVDGGVDAGTARECVSHGANVLVAGSAVFGAADPAQAYRALAEVSGAG